MKKTVLIIAILVIQGSMYSQKPGKTNVDTTLQFEEVVITGTRTERSIKDIPAQVEVIKVDEIENYPVNNIDDILRAAANVYVNRSWGIFSKNSAVTMRGLMGSDRTLVLIDGVPKNKLAGGPVNWHNVNPGIVESIEILKGPASALYGNNAMGGVINIITKKPKKKLAGSVKGFAGTYNTYGSSANVMGSNIENGKGFYWDINGFYRQGDGYIFEPAEEFDSTDVETYLQEYGGGSKIGYQLNKDHSVEMVYDYYDELRGDGREVYEDGGSYNAFLTQQIRGIYKGKVQKSNIKLSTYWLREDYDRQKESLNRYAEYKLADNNTIKNDKGVWLTWSNEIFKNNRFTLGGEVKSGDVEGEEIYRTTPDIIEYEGTLDVYALFIQDEISLFNNKVKIVAGIRNDIVEFHDGWQEVQDPTKVTGFQDDTYEEFGTNSWNAISPKIALQYNFNNTTNAYVSYSTGFKPPKIDDLCKSGKIRKGFRLANPELEPEKIYNYELGFKKQFQNKLSINTAVYYSRGHNFHYLVGTGDSVDTGGSSLKAVLQRENVTDVEITGAELSLRYKYNKNIHFDANYAYNHSIILNYHTKEDNPTKDLEGLYMVEVSPHIFYAGITWNNKILKTGINCHYTDEQYVDDENNQLIEDYFIVNLKLSKTFMEHYTLWFGANNIFDVEFIDRKNRLSPGRFIVGGFQFNF